MKKDVDLNGTKESREGKNDNREFVTKGIYFF